jgi:hypothetical protein
MRQGLRELHSHELAAELEKAIAPALAERLATRGPGHCMRVGDLDRDVMIRLCERLRREHPSATVVMLHDGRERAIPAALAVSATKLVELRNPDAEGRLRPPLLVFIPADARTAAEDSFGVATFEEVDLGPVLPRLAARLLQAVPSAMRGALTEGLARLTTTDDRWPYADEERVIRFLLTAKVNGGDAEAYGGALYELGLVPDFALLADPAKTPARMVRNRDCVRRLTWSERSERARVLELGLSDRAFRKILSDFVAETGLANPLAWTRRIVLERGCWPLAFQRWDFEDGGGEPEAVGIHGVVTDLPVVDDNTQDARLEQLLGQQILPLGGQGLRAFGVRFEVEPAPSAVPGLAKFVAQVVSQEQGPVGLVATKKAWSSKTRSARLRFGRLARIDWEEGWHFVRILAQTEEGDLIPLVDREGAPLPWAADEDASVRRANESELFYVLPAGDVEVEPSQRAVPNEQSVAHALLKLQFAALADDRDPTSIALRDVRWSERRAGQRAGTEMIEARFTQQGAIHVPVSRHLQGLEQKILRLANGPVCWRIPIHLGVPEASAGEAVRWPAGAATVEFLTARKAYFDAVRADDKDMITQGAALASMRPLVVDYAGAYLALVQALGRRAETSDPLEAQRALADLRRILTVDAVTLVLSDHRHRRREATLVAPTHPLRALWLATWSALGQTWVEAARQAPRESIATTRDALLNDLTPLGFPPVLPTESGRMLTAVDSLNPFWTLYAPADEEDPRSLIGEVCAAFGLPEPGLGGAVIDGAYLAARVERYLLQHPYVTTLVINAFNAGRGAILAELLLKLQSRPAFADLRYDLRLFVPDAEAPGVGDAVAELLSPVASVTAKEADAFSAPSGHHLYPKLRLAIRPTAAFRAAPERHAAHLTLLFDVFPAEEIGAARASEREGSAPVHGLIQDVHVAYREDGASVAWQRQPRHGQAAPLPGAEELTDLLAEMAGALSSAAATVATGQTGLGLRPVMTLALTNDERALLHQVHEVSDWVMTLDRHLGIEFFDHGGRPNRPDYLIDHSPAGLNLPGHRLVITSRSVAELEAMLRPVLHAFGLDAEGRHAVALLEQLRSLSGRLALKLLSAPTQRAEALGLALSRLYLEHQGAFENQIVVPLDAHLELYRAMKVHVGEIGEEISFKRTDLALFDLNATERRLTCRLVEVKCYTQVGDLAAFNQLKSSVAAQIDQSQAVLAYHFDPHRSAVDRPDRLIKTRELATLLEFYLERAERYAIIAEDAAEEARFFLRTLEDGYRLSFTRSAMIFDFEKPGTELPEVEHGIEFHRIGIDLIRQLVEAAAPSTETLARPTGADGATRDFAEQRRERLQERRERAPSVPTLGTAAFLGRFRDRTVSWETMRAGAETAARYAQGTSPESRLPQVADPTKDDSPVPATLTNGANTPASRAEPAAGDGAKAEMPAGDAPETAVPVEPPAPEQAEARTDPSVPAYDVMLGVTQASPQFGLLGESSGRKVALDLNQTHTISLFGVQGGGKSYTLGAIAEMASLAIPRINHLTQPLATVIFHYSPTMDYRPEFTSMVAPNSDDAQLARLRTAYGAEPQALRDAVLLVPGDKLGERQQEFPGLEIHPLKFAAAELQTSHWRFLMGAVGNQATYIRQLNRVMKSLRNALTLDALRQGIDNTNLSEHLKDLARMRLDLAAEYIDDSVRLGDLIRPGRLVIVDLRDEFIEKDEALGLFVVLLQLFADAEYQGRGFNKLVVFDEAHKYIDSPDLVAGLIEVVREMRHKGTSILVASQDPPSVPVSLIELSSQMILHKFNSPAWLKHIQKANAALSGLTPERMAHLKAGEAYIWSSKATDDAFSKGAMKVQLRPRVTQHGGDTKTALDRDV